MPAPSACFIRWAAFNFKHSAIEALNVAPGRTRHPAWRLVYSWSLARKYLTTSQARSSSKTWFLVRLACSEPEPPQSGHFCQGNDAPADASTGQPRRRDKAVRTQPPTPNAQSPRQHHHETRAVTPGYLILCVVLPIPLLAWFPRSLSAWAARQLPKSRGAARLATLTAWSGGHDPDPSR